MEENIPQELLRYLKQQNLSSVPLLPAMQRLQSRMDGTLSRRDLGEDEKAKQFLHIVLGRNRCARDTFVWLESKFGVYP